MKIRSQMDRFFGGINHVSSNLSRQQRRSLERKQRREPRPSLAPESLEARALLAVVVPGYEVTQDWGSGFQGSMTLENRDTEAVAKASALQVLSDLPADVLRKIADRKQDVHVLVANSSGADMKAIADAVAKDPAKIKKAVGYLRLPFI